MKRQNSIHEISHDLPEGFDERLQDLEILMSQGKLTHNTLQELFHLYSVRKI